MDVKTDEEYPFEILDLDPEVSAQRMKHFNDQYPPLQHVIKKNIFEDITNLKCPDIVVAALPAGRSAAARAAHAYKDGDNLFVRVGPKGYFLPKKFRQEALKIYTMPLKSTDVFVASFPRSGTTWTQELVWLMVNDLDYEKSKTRPLSERYIFIEYSAFLSSTLETKLSKKNAGCEMKAKILKEVMTSGVEVLATTPSPRFIKTHLPMSLLPWSLLDTAKVVYVARDPRDVAVSFCHFNQNMSEPIFLGDFKTFWNYLINDMQLWSPYFEHLKEAWQNKDHPNMLFLFYEELSKDLPAVVRRVAKFFNKEITDEQIIKLCDHLRIDNFQNTESLDLKDLREIGIVVPQKETFIRKGKVGGWRNHFDDEMTKEADRWIEENLRGTDLHFPS